MAFFKNIILALCLYLEVSSLIPQTAAALEASKYQVTIKVNGSDPARPATFCSGTFVGSKWILTAARCVTAYGLYNAAKYMVNPGEKNQLEVSNVFVHPKHDAYKNFGYNYNFALIEVNKDANMSSIEIAKYKTGNAIATGYGFRQKNGDHELDQVDVTVMDQNGCSRVHSYRPDDSIFCGGNSENCQLDIGSPLVQDGNLVGVFIDSHDHDCRSNKPGVYARPAAVKMWIKEVTQQK